MNKVRIGLLAGTFDPIHIGHTQLARAAFEQGNLKEVWLLINADPTHKMPVASYEDRLMMAKLAVKGYENIIVDREPIQKAKSEYSVDTLRQLHIDYPNHRFVIIMGEDQFRGVRGWKDYEEVASLAEFAVARRGGSTEALRLPKYAPIDMPPIDISSSLVKIHLRSGYETLPLSPEVVTYISKKGLYT